MKVSLKWLKDYVDIVTTPTDLARRLTMAGIEVTSITDTGAIWDRERVLVGQVTALAPHPNADRLQLVTVDYSSPGAGPRSITVITGAFNIAVGDKVPLALAGARLRNEHSGNWEWTTLKPGKIRGIESAGMVCSARELDLGDDHQGILILDKDAPVGMPLADYLGDVILDLEIKGRWDCLSLLGLAREVAALQRVQLRQPVALRLPPDDYPTAGPHVDELISLEIADPDLCPRYSATVIRGVKVGPSPRWLQERLLAAGMRPINNIVDVTNYVMLEWNQPLHAFDYDKIQGHKIIVRRAGEWTSFCTLDGQGRDLAPEMLVIADAKGPVAVAGIMGGLESEVTESTVNVLLESANFHPVSIRRTARALKISSEAQLRFEKGLPPEQTVPAARRATRLILELAGGVAAPGVADCYPVPRQRQPIRLPVSEVKRLLGVAYTPAQIARVLDALECRWALGETLPESPKGQEQAPTPASMDATAPADLGNCSKLENGHRPSPVPEVFTVLPPYQRMDLTIPADLVEEIARLIGYDEIPTTLLRGEPPAWQPNIARDREDMARDALVNAGFWEVLTYPLTSRAAMNRLLPQGATVQDPLAAAIASRLLDVTTTPVTIANPLTPEMSVLRTTALPSLLDALARNLRHQDRDVALFELARIYIPRENDLPEERRVLTAAIGQYVSGTGWRTKEEVDFFYMKGVCQALLDRLGVRSVVYRPVNHPSFHPGRTAVILVAAPNAAAQNPQSAIPLGLLGELHPAVRAAFDLNERVYVLTLDFERVIEMGGQPRPYRPLSKFPPVMRDLAVVVDAGVPAARVEEAIWQGGGRLLRSVALFDRYEGDPIPPGKVSLAYTLTFQADDRTLTDEEVAAVHKKIVNRLAATTNATIRSGNPGDLPRQG